MLVIDRDDKATWEIFQHHSYDKIQHLKYFNLDTFHRYHGHQMQPYFPFPFLTDHALLHAFYCNLVGLGRRVVQLCFRGYHRHSS